MKKQLLKGGLAFAVSVTLSMLAGETAQAQAFPTKPVNVVLSNIGGNSDLTLRALSGVAEKYLGQPLLLSTRWVGREPSPPIWLRGQTPTGIPYSVQP